MEKRTCKITNQEFEISDKEIAFCKRMGVPLPETCRPERIRILMAARNEWKLYRRKCDFSGDEIISAYPPDSPFKVYKNEVWWGNEWNAMEYGRDFDFSRPFFEQFAELQKEVPREGTSVFNSENCDYNGHIRESKNCYLNSLIYKCEDVHYSYWMVNDKDVMDSMYTNDSDLCYSCISVNKGYGCVMLEESNNCNYCHFSYQLRGCDHCIFCTNLTNKKYHIFNKPVSEEEFENTKKKILNGSWSRWKEAYEHYLKIREMAVHRYAHNLNCENVTGDHLYNCRNCEGCFESFDSEDCLNGISLSGSKDAQNIYSAGWAGCEAVYNCSVIRSSKKLAFCSYTWQSSDMLYCDSCNGCDNCFGCIGLQHKKYCILNKQYTKEEYDELIPKIVEHMKSTDELGNFFPPALSPFAYNESCAQDFLPLEKEQAQKMGWRWMPKNEKEYQPATISDIPDNIKDVDESITKEILACEECGKNYKILKQELKFYHKANLPIPHYCPECRHRIRFQLRNPLSLFGRKCNKCEKPIQTSYGVERKEKVYCEDCYLKSVY